MKRRKTGITFGAFDLCHAGHVLMLKECKKYCDFLIAGLQNDPSKTPREYRGKKKNKPIMTLEERKIILEGIKYVDKIVIYESEADLYELLKKLKPNVRIIGSDWKGKKFTGHDLPIKVVYNSRSHSFSSTELRDRIYKVEKKKRLADERKR